MGFFSRKKPAPAPAATPPVPVPVDTMIHVKGVGGYQSLLVGPPRRVKVELMAWEKGDTITAKLDGQRVGEIDYSSGQHEILLAIRRLGLPPVIVDGEIRKGDYVPRFLAVALPSARELKAFLPAGWGPPESSVNVHMTSRYQEALAALHDPKARLREAAVSFSPHVGGKYNGEAEGVVTLNDQTIGELSASNTEKWALILSDREAGIPGQLMVRIGSTTGKDGGPSYYVEAIYKRQAS
jgi:hypothetical protein